MVSNPAGLALAELIAAAGTALLFAEAGGGAAASVRFGVLVVGADDAPLAAGDEPAGVAEAPPESVPGAEAVWFALDPEAMADAGVAEPDPSDADDEALPALDGARDVEVDPVDEAGLGDGVAAGCSCWTAGACGAGALVVAVYVPSSVADAPVSATVDGFDDDGGVAEGDDGVVGAGADGGADVVRGGSPAEDVLPPLAPLPNAGVDDDGGKRLIKDMMGIFST